MYKAALAEMPSARAAFAFLYMSVALRRRLVVEVAALRALGMKRKDDQRDTDHHER